ncbi:MAG TPA: type II secretion system protein [Candidatus Saccharimonadales bacterium]|nr:type II secretion system protein [Candidatus Saccharimonadales bacterium]
MKRPRQSSPGFTVIELLVVIVLLGILLALVTLTYSGVRAKNRNAARETTIDKIQIQFETYYARTSTYPTLANLNTASWRTQNLPKLAANALQDPHWNKANRFCTTAGHAVATTAPASSCYSYQVTGADGSTCDNSKTICAHYTLTASLEGGQKYVKSSLN